MKRPRLHRLMILVSVAVLAAATSACSSAASRPQTTSPSAPPKVRRVVTPPVTASTLPRALKGGAATVLVLGDSVILGAQPQIETRLAGWTLTFNAKVSRSIYAGVSILASRTGPKPRVVVVHLCTNWGSTDFGHQIDRTMAALTGVDRVIWVTCNAWNPSVLDADAAIGVASVRYPNVVVADWAPMSSTPGYTYSDHLHLRTPGAQALAELIGRAVGPAPAPTAASTTTSTS